MQFDELLKIVRNKPMVCISQSVEEWTTDDSLDEIASRDRFSHAFDRAVIGKLRVPTIAIIQFHHEKESVCALAYIDKKLPITTTQVKIQFKMYGQISFANFQEIAKAINKPRYKTDFLSRIKNDVFMLSPELSAEIVNIFITSEHNTLAALVDDISEVKNDVLLARGDAVDLALKTFGIPINKKNRFKSSDIEMTLNEDMVISKDAAEIDGYIGVKHSYIGKTAFKRLDEILTVYHANKQPLEKMIGVDLIYVNETRGNIVMVQYKMLEPQKNDVGDEVEKNEDWIYRPDKQVAIEIERMIIPTVSSYTDYRLNSNPFYFRFIKRRSIHDDEVTAFNIALDHYKMLVEAPESKGKKGGIRISFNALNGVYLRQTEFVELISSGYIGTHSVDTALLKAIIDEVAKGNREIVVAWQQKYHGRTGDLQ